MTRLTLFIFLYAIVLSNHASEQITGAFGKLLGDSFEEELEKSAELDSGEILYRFQPANPSPMFKKYGVLLTPTTREIVAIWAWISFDRDSRPQCKEDLKVVEAVLDRKYEQLKTKLDLLILDGVFYKSGNRRIRLRCTTLSDQLQLIYRDEEMEEQAILEKAAKIDGSSF